MSLVTDILSLAVSLLQPAVLLLACLYLAKQDRELTKLRNRIINEQDIRHKQVVELQQLNKKCWQQLSGISYKVSGKATRK